MSMLLSEQSLDKEMIFLEILGTYKTLFRIKEEQSVQRLIVPM